MTTNIAEKAVDSLGEVNVTAYVIQDHDFYHDAKLLVVEQNVYIIAGYDYMFPYTEKDGIVTEYQDINTPEEIANFLKSQPPYF